MRSTVSKLWAIAIANLQNQIFSMFLQQIPNKPTTRFFIKAPQSGAFIKNLGLVYSQSAVNTDDLINFKAVRSK